MRATEHAPRGWFNLRERPHALAEIVERGAGVEEERPRVNRPLVDFYFYVFGASTPKRVFLDALSPCPVSRYVATLHTPRRRRRLQRLAGAERGSRVPQLELNLFGGRVRTAEHAPRGPPGGVPPRARGFQGSRLGIRASGR